jgi:hypothetical protein
MALSRGDFITQSQHVLPHRSGDFTSPSGHSPSSPDRTPKTGDVKSPLHEQGYRVTSLPVDRDGLLKVADLEAAIPRVRDQTAVVSQRTIEG